MTASFMRRKQEVTQLALCLLVGILCGGILLLDLPLKWQLAAFAVLGMTVPLLLADSPKRPLLFLLAFTVPVYFGKAVIIRSWGLPAWKDAVDINLSDVLTLTLLLVLLAKLALRRTTIRFVPQIMIPALAWVVSSALSLLAARDSQLAVIQLMTMGKLLLFGWVVANSVEDEGDLNWVISGLMLALFFEGLVGTFQGVTGRPLGLDFLTETSAVGKEQLSVGLVNRVQGTIGHPNAYAMYLATGIPFALAFLFSRARRSSKALAGIPLLFGCLALLYTLSRSGWINFLLIFGIVLTLAVRRKRISLGAAVLIAGIAFLILLGLTLFGPDFILSRLTSSDRGSAYSRITQAKAALAIIKDHPLWGVGLNNYAQVSFAYDPTGFATWRGAPFVHNVFLLIAAETGLIGLAAFLVFLAILLVEAWQIIHRAPNETVWVAGVGAFAALVALIAHSMVDYALLGSLQTITQFWLLAGLCAALSPRVAHEQQDVRPIWYGSVSMVRPFRLPEIGLPRLGEEHAAVLASGLDNTYLTPAMRDWAESLRAVTTRVAKEVSLTQGLPRNTILNLIGWAWPIGLAIVSVPYIVTRLGNDAYGIFSIVSLVAGYLGLLEAPVAMGAVRFMAEAYAREDWSELRQAAFGGLVVSGVLSALGGVIMFAAAGWLATRVFAVPPALAGTAVTAFRLAALGFVQNGLTRALEDVPAAMRRYDILNAAKLVLGTLSTLAIVLALWRGWGLVGAVVGQALASALALALFAIIAWLLLRKFPGAWPKLHVNRTFLRRLAPFSFLLFAGQMTSQIGLQIDRTMVGMLLGTSALAYYTVPTKITDRIPGMMYVFCTALYPLSAEAAATGKVGELRVLYNEVIRILLLLSALIATLLIALSKQLLTLWIGPEFMANSWLVLALLAASVVWRSSGSVAYQVCTGMGRADIYLVGSIVTAVCLIVPVAVLAPRWGAPGVALAVFIGLSISNLLYDWYTRRKVLGSKSLREWLVPYARIVPAVAGPVLLFHLSPVRLGGWIGLFVSACLVSCLYLVGVLVTGALTLRDVRFVASKAMRIRSLVR